MNRAILEIAKSEFGVKQKALEKWKERGRVPYRWRIPILKAAAVRHISIAEADFDFCPKG